MSLDDLVAPAPVSITRAKQHELVAPDHQSDPRMKEGEGARKRCGEGEWGENRQEEGEGARKRCGER